MAYPVLGRSDDALDAVETENFLRQRLGDGLLATTEEYGTFTVDVSPSSWVDAVTLCRDAELLAYDMFDCLFGVDAGEDGFDVVAILYSTSRGRRILLRGRAEGGRENPTFPTITHLFPGADWMERETWDMFGIEFTDHPGLAPRLLCTENFEGWPLRKDFYLASRAVKPWPGVKEPAETDEEGNVLVKVPGPGEAPGPSVLDELMASQSKAANPQVEEAVEEGPAHTEEPPERAEMELDQETYDRLIAEGKSERIARSKAKAAFVKQQRAAGGERASSDQPSPDAQPTAEPDTEQVQAAAEGTPGPSDADQVATDVDDAAEAAAVRAEQVRDAQAEARAEKAAEQAAEQAASGTTDEASSADEDEDAPIIPEGTPPADEASSDDEDDTDKAPSDDEAASDDEEQP